MLLGLGITILFGHAKVDDVDNIGRLGAGTTDQEVVGFDVTVNQVLLMDCLNSGQHLFGDHDHRFDGEAASAVVEEVFERRTQQVNDQNVVKTLLAKIIHIGNSGWSSGQHQRYGVARVQTQVCRQ
jgi:hypothetical protein